MEHLKYCGTDTITPGIGNNLKPGEVLLIPLDEICLNPVQPRKKFEEEKIRELSESIKKYGVLQPVIVTRKDGLYHLVVGERRLRASKLLKIDKIPAVVKEYGWEEMLKVALVENLQRQDLNPMEEARSYNLLIREYNLTQEQVADSIGHSRPYVANMVRLLNLPREIIRDVEEGELTSGHARTLLGLEDPLKMLQLALKIKKGNLSVRQTEELVRRMKKPESRKGKERNIRAGQYGKIEERLARRFSARVSIRESGKKGRIEISYNSKEELERILDNLEGREGLI